MTIIIFVSSAFPYTGILEDFNDDDQTPVPGFTAREGSASIISNQIGGTTSGENYVTYDTQFNADQEFYITMTTLCGYDEGISFLFRMSGGSNGYGGDGYDFQCQRRDPGEQSHQLRLFRFDAGQFGDLLGEYNPPDMSAGDSFGIRAEGTRIRCYYRPVGSSWSCVIDVDDTEGYNHAGYSNFGMYANNGRYDNFGGGNI